MEASEQIVKRKVIDPVRAEENLLKAALEYAQAIEAKRRNDDAPIIERRL